MNAIRWGGFLLFVVTLLGCSSEDIPPAHKGRMFEKTGFVFLWSGHTGFVGPVLQPGTQYTGVYNEVRMLDCSTRTFKEPMTSMTRDGVQFALDVYITCGSHCTDDRAVGALLDRLAPQGATAKTDSAPAPGAGQATPDERDPVESNDKAVTSRQVYNTFIRPALGEAVRQAVSGYDANDLNSHRDELFGRIQSKLEKDLGIKIGVDAVDDKAPLALVSVVNFNLSNFKLPDEMAQAAADRATQQVLRDKAVAARETIQAETETAKLAVAKAEAEAQAEAKKVDVVGAALHRNPEYYLRDVYYYAADKGGSIVLPADPHVILNMTPRAK